MFGALNRFISRLDGDPQEGAVGLVGASGFQVLKNGNQELRLEPWFDFIVGINGRNLDDPDPNLFAAEIRNSAGSTINLGIWSAKGQRIREIYVPVPKDQPSLGLSLQWTPLTATEDVWHVLDVTPGSPADLAGLLPYGDYIIGSPEGIVSGESGLGELVQDFLDRPLKLLVYNHEYDITRPVEITPGRQWGGQGALGCTLGFGALHRIPASLEEPPHAPGETMFDTSMDEKQQFVLTAAAPPSEMEPPAGSEEFLVPANIQFESPAPAAGLPRREKKARAHHLPPTTSMDEYFKEGEEKSREQDHAPTKKGSGIPPPPPKMGSSKSPAPE